MRYRVMNIDRTFYDVDTDASPRACCLECERELVVEEAIGAIQSHPDPDRPMYLCAGGGTEHYLPDAITFAVARIT